MEALPRIRHSPTTHRCAYGMGELTGLPDSWSVYTEDDLKEDRLEVMIVMISYHYWEKLLNTWSTHRATGHWPGVTRRGR